MPEQVKQIQDIAYKVLPKLMPSAVLYTETPPPASPFFPTYACSACIHYMKETSKCVIVEGDIKQTSWCIAWFPAPTSLPIAATKAMMKLPMPV